MSRKKIDISEILRLPLETTSQEKAASTSIKCVSKGQLKIYDKNVDNPSRFILILKERLNRSIVSALVGCVHCGYCKDSCHYALARPDDPTMTPVYKADQIRKIFKRCVDWTGRVFPEWVKAKKPVGIDDLNQLKNIVFGTCSACRRCTYNCPMGVDTASLIRFTRGILTELGIVPEGVFNVSRDQWETGNQMAISEEDYLETIDWMRQETADEYDIDNLQAPIDKEGCDFIYTINPREIKFDPRSLGNAMRIFHVAGESWTLPRYGWDQTNFGLFSGDDVLGAHVAHQVYEAARRLRAKRIVISECGHGYRSTRWEGYNWAKENQDIPSESVLLTIKRYLEEGRISVDSSRNSEAVTFHDSCNIARSGDITEEPRWILRRVCSDFREMHPNRTENYCCTGGSGLLSMPEYKTLRLEVAKIKAKQLKAIGAKIVCTMCHNCVDGLTDVIEHYDLDMKVVQVMDLVANAMVS